MCLCNVGNHQTSVISKKYIRSFTIVCCNSELIVRSPVFPDQTQEELNVYIRFIKKKTSIDKPLQEDLRNQHMHDKNNVHRKIRIYNKNEFSQRHQDWSGGSRDLNRTRECNVCHIWICVKSIEGGTFSWEEAQVVSNFQ